MSRSIKLDPDGIPAYLKKHDEPVTDENRMRRLPEHTPVPAKARRERVLPSTKSTESESADIPKFLLRDGY